MKFFAALMLSPLLSAQIMYVGTYTAPQSSSKGIYAYRFDSKTGKAAPLGLMAETPDPTFIVIHPNGKYLYAINEVNTFEGKAAGSVTAFSIDRASGKLTQINQVSSGGPGPCHLSIDSSGKAVFVANYAGGSFASFPILEGGRLGEAASFEQLNGTGPDKGRQSEPHGHSANLPKNNKFMLGADLGTDKVMIYKTDLTTSKITANDPPFAMVKAGSGPRHLVFAPDQKHVYVLSEMAATVTTFEYNAGTAAMKEIDVASALPSDFTGEKSAAEIEIDPHGKYLYTSNRGHNSIAVFAIDPKTAKPTLIQNQSSGGAIPRAFVIDPSGNYIVAGNQNTNNIAILKIDPATGKLSATDEKPELGAPVTFAFLK